MPKTFVRIKLFITVLTLMLQSFVSSHVVFEIFTGIKTSPAYLTVIRKISCVQLHMLVQMTFRGVALITLGAGKSVAILSTLISAFSLLILLHNTKKMHTDKIQH